MKVSRELPLSSVCQMRLMTKKIILSTIVPYPICCTTEPLALVHFTSSDNKQHHKFPHLAKSHSPSRSSSKSNSKVSKIFSLSIMADCDNEDSVIWWTDWSIQRLMCLMLPESKPNAANARSKWRTSDCSWSKPEDENATIWNNQAKDDDTIFIQGGIVN